MSGLSVPAPDRSLAAVLLGLALGMAASSLLGPVGLGLIRYRTSETTLNQLLGSDAAVLAVGVPLTLAAAALVLRRHPSAPLLAAGVGGYATYTYAQVVVGQEYLRLPGTVEQFFPLLLAVFILAETAVVLGWRSSRPPPPLTPRLRRTVGTVLVGVAVFLVVGLHLRSLVTAWVDPLSLVEYASSPTPFWLVKLMDLGIVVPLALATGIGVLRDAAWAPRLAYVVLTGYTCLATSVAAMGVVMIVNADPDASPGLTAGFLAFAVAFVVLTVLLYRPLFARSRSGAGEPARPA